MHLAEFALRRAEAGDAPAIRALVREGRINPFGLDWRRFVVAVTPSGEVIGCGQVKAHRDGSRELASIAVRRAYRGRGVARAIIERLLAENPPPLYLMCRASLGPFYEPFGFQAVAFEEMPPHFRRVVRLARWLRGLRGSGEALLVMRRP